MNAVDLVNHTPEEKQTFVKGLVQFTNFVFKWIVVDLRLLWVFSVITCRLLFFLELDLVVLVEGQSVLFSSAVPDCIIFSWMNLLWIRSENNIQIVSGFISGELRTMSASSGVRFVW